MFFVHKLFFELLSVFAVCSLASRLCRRRAGSGSGVNSCGAASGMTGPCPGVSVASPSNCPRVAGTASVHTAMGQKKRALGRKLKWALVFGSVSEFDRVVVPVIESLACGAASLANSLTLPPRGDRECAGNLTALYFAVRVTAQFRSGWASFSAGGVYGS